MRTKRVEKFRKYRHEKMRKFILFGLILPCMSIFVGYLITSLFILPTMVKR